MEEQTQKVRLELDRVPTLGELSELRQRGFKDAHMRSRGGGCHLEVEIIADFYQMRLNQLLASLELVAPGIHVIDVRQVPE